ncbi:MAG: DUF1638 domain-containing protein [Gammaproteobacteria bacterium]|nr:DUF1638 domain-containing protein [Gammaproteobacteria bacterium]MCY4314049.1 DUF1638 domain-containing protein [Gammaproteobacteria bacterium]
MQPEQHSDCANGKLLVIACGALAHELVRVRDLNNWNHIEFQCLPAALHNYPEKIPEAVRKKIRENRDHFSKIFIGYADCGTGGLLDKVIEQEGVERLPGAHCYELFAGAEKFNALHEYEIGTFYLTDYLASNFDRLIVSGLGIDRYPELKDQYFGHYSKLIYLAQKQNSKTEHKARQAAEFLGLAFEQEFTGDTGLNDSLKVVVNDFGRVADSQA